MPIHLTPGLTKQTWRRSARAAQPGSKRTAVAAVPAVQNCAKSAGHVAFQIHSPGRLFRAVAGLFEAPAAGVARVALIMPPKGEEILASAVTLEPGADRSRLATNPPRFVNFVGRCGWEA